MERYKDSSEPHIGMTLTQDALELMDLLCRRYQITALEDFLQSCHGFQQESILNIAVLGRFKTGKSSFLNHLLGRSILPVGVIPVTAVVVELQYAPQERAEVHFKGGSTTAVDAQLVDEYVAEEKNPGNIKEVTLVRIDTPAMSPYRGIRFVDTPGLESALEHNTAVSMEWAPNVGLALVAIGADVPLSQHDVQFIRTLTRYTPNISILLTKVDILDEPQQTQVRLFIEQQIERQIGRSLPIFPYSIRPGFEALRSELDNTLLSHARAASSEERERILNHKVISLMNECAAYMRIALRASETADSEKADLRLKILGQAESLADMRTALRLIVRHAAGSTRSTFEALLLTEESPAKRRLLSELDTTFPAWLQSLAAATAAFEDWLRAEITEEMTTLSKAHARDFTESLHRVARQLSQSLQDFRNRLSERTLNALGVPLPTTEVDLEVKEPRSPDVRIGKIFDHNWELLSFAIPVKLVQGILKKHFRLKVEDAAFMNLSRLTSQWEEIINNALFSLEAESLRRLDNLIATISKLLEMNGPEAPQIRTDLETVEMARLALIRKATNET